MTQQATAPAAAPTAPAEPGSGVTIVPSLEDRSRAAFDGLETAGDATATAPPDGSSPAASSPSEDAEAKARTERRAALAAATAKERERVDVMSARREAEQLRAKLAEYEARPKEAPAPAIDGPESFFAMAQQLAASGKLTPQQLGEWIREQTANPELAAASAATKLVDPKLSALEKRIADQQKVIDEFMQRQQHQAEQAEEQHAANQFFRFTTENAGSAPKCAAFLNNFGPQEFYKLALKASESVPASAGPQAVLDEIEENLVRFGAIYGAQPGAPVNQRTPAPTTPQNHAPAKAPTTISNTLAQTRATVVDEDAEFASLPFEERSRRAFGL
jgi:hypothetical protein